MKPYQATGLRVPFDLHGRIVAAAAAARRSMNSEILARLEASFRPDERSGLVPCPDCSAAPVTGWTAREGGPRVHFVHCPDCDTWAEADTDTAAMAAWNAVAQRQRGAA